MRLCSVKFGVGLLMFLAALLVLSHQDAFAQDDGNGGGGTIDITRSTMASQAGVAIDASGVLTMRMFNDPNLKARIAAGAKNISRDLVKFTPERYVSLTRLERQAAEAKGDIPDEVRYMAGLQKINYVLVYPETGDVVLVGPAEGWYKDITGRVVGLTTGKPVLRLDDMVAAMRAFPPGKRDAPLIGCSIDPTSEGLANLQKYLSKVGGMATPADTKRIAMGLRNNLGMQTVTVQGVDPRTHFARTLVEADYRMKLIGIGLEQPPVPMNTFIGNVTPAQMSRNALARWYFVPEYECVRVSPDKLALALEGQGVKLMDANEMVAADGQRSQAATVNAASKAFAQSFTANYPKISQRSPIYAELRNLIDMSVVAAYLQKENIYGKLDWKLTVLGDESRFPIQTENAPTQVPSAVNAVWKGRTLMTPIGGGVEIFPAKALSKEHLLSDNDEKVAQRRAKTEAKLPETGWWW